MVLKKSKGSFARTGNTVRKGGKQSMQRALKAAFISKNVGNHDISPPEQRDELFDGEYSWDGHAPLSLNKKNRWMIPERLEERCKNTREETDGANIQDDSKRKRQSKKKITKNQKDAEEYSTKKKTKVIEKTLLSSPNQCKTVYDFTGDNHSVRRGKSWRYQRDSKEDSTYDAVFEIASGLPSQTWPLNIISQWRHDDRLYDEYFQIGGKSSRNRRRFTTTEIVTDICEFEDYSDFDEETDLSDADGPSPVDIAECCNTFSLNDFTITTRAKKKQSKPVKKKVNSCIDIWMKEAEEVKDRELIYIDKEEAQNEVMSEQQEYQPIVKRRENTGESDTEKNITQTISQYSSLDGYKEMEMTVETSTITQSRLEQLYGKGFFKGRSRPRKFGIIVNSCFDDNEFGTGKKCFIIAEQINIDSLKSQTTINVKLIGNERVVEKVAEQMKKSGMWAFENLSGQVVRLQLLRTETEKPDIPYHLQKLTKWNPRCLPADEALHLLAEELFLGRREEDAEKDDEGAFKDIEMLTFQCGICFEDLTSLSADEPMMQLEKCLHSFCKNCWVSYLKQKAKEQTLIITCPGHGCKETVDMVTLLSMLQHNLVKLCLKNTFEQFLAMKHDWQWCPGCDRVANCPGYLPLETPSKVCDTPVLKCSCSKMWCFECQETQHWPMNCEDMKRYKVIFQSEAARIFDEFGQIYQTIVAVKHCPFCRTPINKNGGCSNMVCRCSRAFCWRCARPNCTASNCKEIQLKTITFTSADSLGDQSQNKGIKRALKFSYMKKELNRRKTKLGIARQSTSVDKRHPNNSLMGMLNKMIIDLVDICMVLEHISATGSISQSKHYRVRLYQFTDRMQWMLSNINEALIKDHIMEVNMKEVNEIADKVRNHLVTFINTELHKKHN